MHRHWNSVAGGTCRPTLPLAFALGFEVALPWLCMVAACGRVPHELLLYHRRGSFRVHPTSVGMGKRLPTNSDQPKFICCGPEVGLLDWSRTIAAASHVRRKNQAGSVSFVAPFQESRHQPGQKSVRRGHEPFSHRLVVRGMSLADSGAVPLSRDRRHVDRHFAATRAIHLRGDSDLLSDGFDFGDGGAA